MVFEINQDIVWWKGPSNGRLTAIRGSVLSLRDERVHILLEDGRRRWVDRERLQIVRLWHHAWLAPDYIQSQSPLSDWGSLTIYNEITEDLFPNRCIYEFENGKRLRYDRLHWFDEYGCFGTLAYCHFRWAEFWGETTEITGRDFGNIWHSAGVPDDDVAKLNRKLPSEMVGITPWTRRPIKIGK